MLIRILLHPPRAAMSTVGEVVVVGSGAALTSTAFQTRFGAKRKKRFEIIEIQIKRKVIKKFYYCFGNAVLITRRIFFLKTSNIAFTIFPNDNIATNILFALKEEASFKTCQRFLLMLKVKSYALKIRLMIGSLLITVDFITRSTALKEIISDLTRN